MQKTRPLLILVLLFILAINFYGFYKINKNYKENTFYILTTKLNKFNDNDVKNDIKYINDNYAFYQLKTENNKLKYDFAMKSIWTFDLIIFASAFLFLKYPNRKKSI